MDDNSAINNTNPNMQDDTAEAVVDAASTAADDVTADSSAATEGQDDIARIEAERDELKDKYLRLQAEFDNFRKRTLKEKMELLKSGGESVLKAVLPVIDDFDRAIVAFADDPDDAPQKQGIMLIYNKFRDFLKHNGVHEIEAVGTDFDTDLHEAITKIPAADAALKNKVVDIIQKGYMLNDKVLRFAKVVVGE
ncbi:MAG: nucleotide exchange factor GrpE [Bacteroidales bacterium]|jgi:molecular chaperone GrpE|nr:nucleotide exchange factor GrpE [Bacteroidales bacterium]